jgi:hypothetical protein
VNNANIADDTTFTGFIIRNEKIFNTKQSGYIHYYNPAGNRVGVGDILYTIDSTGELSDYLADIDNSQAPSTEEINNIRTIISSFQEEFSFSDYQHVYDYHFNIENAIFEQTQDGLYNDYEQMLADKGESNSFQKYLSKRAGIISYSMDGLENVKENEVTNEHFKDKNKWEKTQLIENESVEAKTPAYRLIVNQNWSVVIPIDENYYSRIKDKTEIKVTIKKDNNSFDTSVRIEIRPDGYYAVLSMNRFLERYRDDRFLDIELNLNSAEGLKIPNTSLIEKEFFKVSPDFITRGGDGSSGVVTLKYKEDGTEEFIFVPIPNLIFDKDTYYINKELLKAGDIIVKKDTNNKATIQSVGKLTGVYRVNDGFSKFVRIDKIYENSEYTIVSDVTQNGLAIYDNIVTDPSELNENDFIQ